MGRRKWLRYCVCLLLLGAILCAALYARPVGYFLRFGIPTAKSPNDRDHDGLDDFADIVRAARAYVRTKPQYVSAYFDGGYPPEGQGVCTDVVWRALRAAGYDFKAMIDEDIAAHPGAYPLPNGKADRNIDFRRVVNLQVYFQRHLPALTLDIDDIGQWQPGDIVIYDGHVAIASDRRNGRGQPWVIHHTGHGAFEEDGLTYKEIIGHYRWLPDDV